jgi:hypothetical protein
VTIAILSELMVALKSMESVRHLAAQVRVNIKHNSNTQIQVLNCGLSCSLERIVLSLLLDLSSSTVCRL